MKSDHEVRPVRYKGMSFVQNATKLGSQETAKDILTYKLDSWFYEEEERVFITSGTFANIYIREIVLGKRISKEHKSLVKKLVEQTDASVNVRQAQIENFV